MKRQYAWALGCVLGLLSCNRGAPQPQAGAAAPLSVGLAIASPVHALGFIAAEKGFFAAAGLQAAVSVMGGSAATLQALLGERLDLALAGGDVALKANAAGGDLVILAGLVHRHLHRLVARPEIGQPADLRGKRIGLPFTGGPQDMAVRYVLSRHGLVYGSDVVVLNLGRDYNLLTALSRNDIQAATSSLPPAQIQAQGLKILVDLPNEPVHFPYLMLITRRKILASRAQVIKAGLKALCDAMRYYRDPRNADESIALIAPHLGLDPQEAALQVQDAGPSRYTWPPIPEREALIAVAEDARSVDALLEPAPLRELQAAGFCR